MCINTKHLHVFKLCVTASCTGTTATFPVFLANLQAAPCQPALSKCCVWVPGLAVTGCGGLALPTVRSVATQFSPWRRCTCAHSFWSLTLGSASLWLTLSLLVRLSLLLTGMDSFTGIHWFWVPNIVCDQKIPRVHKFVKTWHERKQCSPDWEKC